MKLTELNPEFIGAGGEGCTLHGLPMARREGVGVIFDCPCRSPDSVRCYIPFDKPLDGGPALDSRHVWKRTGDTFETLTLHPSIQRHKDRGACCDWHGFIENGIVRNA
jgi:uncharacterized protein DUF6527